MLQITGYPERGYTVVPSTGQLPSGRYGAAFEIFADELEPPVFRQDSPEAGFATEMAARTYLQQQASNWIDDHPLK